MAFNRRMNVDGTANWSWHAWREAPGGVNRDRTKDTWLGQFKDTESALAWRKGLSGDKAEGVVINQIPPTRVQRERTAGSGAVVGDTTRYTEPVKTPAKRTTTGRTVSRGSLDAPARKARRTSRPETEAVKAAKAKVKVTAAEVLGQHRDDEAADLAAGRNK